MFIQDLVFAFEGDRNFFLQFNDQGIITDEAAERIQPTVGMFNTRDCVARIFVEGDTIRIGTEITRVYAPEVLEDQANDWDESVSYTHLTLPTNREV